VVGAAGVDVVEVVSTRQNHPHGRRYGKQGEIELDRALWPPVKPSVELDEKNAIASAATSATTRRRRSR